MKLRSQHVNLELEYPFRLSLGSRSYTDVVYVELTDGDKTGLGECSLPPYLSETVESVLGYFDLVDLDRLNPDNLLESKAYLETFSKGNACAKAGLEMALLRLASQKFERSSADLLCIKDRPVKTSYTIGISEPDELVEKLKRAKDFEIIKLKLGSDDDRRLIREFRRYSDKPFIVDVNQGWQNLRHAIELAELLKKEGCLFIEQPFQKDNLDSHLEFKNKNILPVYADESIQNFEDFRIKVEAFDGIVVKIMKTAGPLDALQLLKEAAKAGKGTVMGCMAESSVSVSMARVLAPLADYADLDGPLLLRNDPYNLLEYHEGLVSIRGVQ